MEKIDEITLARTSINGDGGNINSMLEQDWSIVSIHHIEGAGELLFVLGRRNPQVLGGS
jgi:hypothetical protein